MPGLARTRHAFVLFGVLAARIGLAQPVDDAIVDYRKWLEEDVAYIISAPEREVFESLATLEERQAFVEAFWRHRDPNRATPQNEFKLEHYRRIDYANEFLGRETFLPGWKTDRGRVHIILGAPREKQVFDGLNEIVPTEIWFYPGDVAGGLPSFFYVAFFKKHDVGDYQLYHPVLDGPRSLLASQYSSRETNVAALQRLYATSPELARVALSLDPSDPGDMRTGEASVGADALLARIEDYPKRSVRSDYVDVWLRHGKRVGADYSFNYVPHRSSFALLPGPEDKWFVHFSIELESEHFVMETDERRSHFYATLDVSVEVDDSAGRLVEVFDNEVPVELTGAEAERVGGSPFAYQGVFPLIPGQFTVRVILRNRGLSQYTVAERKLVVPSLPAGETRLSPIVLGYAVDRLGKAKQKQFGPFQLEAVRIYPAVENTFVIDDEVTVALSVHGMAPDQRLEIALVGDGEVLQTRSVSRVESGSATVTATLSLNGLVGGDYRVTARLLGDGGAVAETSTPLRVSPRTEIFRPGFFSRRAFDTRVPGSIDLAYASQWLNTGATTQARAALELAVAKNEELDAARWGLAWIYIRVSEAERALSLLGPLESSRPHQYEVVAGLGMASYLLRDFDSATRYLERALEIRPPDTLLLNTLGDSYARLGRIDEAKAMFEKSLELRPDQSEIRERLSVLQGA